MWGAVCLGATPRGTILALSSLIAPLFFSSVVFADVKHPARKVLVILITAAFWRDAVPRHVAALLLRENDPGRQVGLEMQETRERFVLHGVWEIEGDHSLPVRRMSLHSRRFEALFIQNRD